MEGAAAKKWRVRRKPSITPPPPTLHANIVKQEMSFMRWCFTENNPEGLLDVQAFGPDLKYLVYGEEVGDTGTEHLQGFCIWDSRKSLSFCKEVIYGAHWEPAHGTNEQAAEYCKKGGIFHEYGELKSSKGQRTDLKRFRDAILAGATDEELLMSDEFCNTMLRNPNLSMKVRALAMKPRFFTDDAPEVIVWFGPTNTGKSFSMFNYCKDNNLSFYVKVPGKWFDGYTGQDAICFDEFVPGEFEISLLLRLLDHYPFNVEVKGASIAICKTTRTFLFTSNVHPDDWYPTAIDEHKNALKRRISRRIQTGEVHQGRPNIIMGYDPL